MCHSVPLVFSVGYVYKPLRDIGQNLRDRHSLFLFGRVSIHLATFCCDYFIIRWTEVVT